jgi:hypothetical protein
VTAPVMVDANGTTVTAVERNGRPIFQVKNAYGGLIRPVRGGRYFDPTTPTDLVDLGVDLATLQEQQ